MKREENERLRVTMVKEYPKICRIPFGRRVGKRYLTSGEVEQLFDGIIVVEEKLDGKTIPMEHGDLTVCRYENRSEDELVTELSKLDNVKEGSHASESASGSLVLKLVDHYVGSHQLSFG